MRYITRGKILVISKNDLAEFTDYCNTDYAFSIYKNACVVWDDDFDHRVLDLVDHMPDLVQEELVAIKEHEGGLHLLWRDYVPSGYEHDIFLDVPCDMDSWIILKSITVSQLPYYDRKARVVTEIT